jgi:hypothetical protein
MAISQIDTGTFVTGGGNSHTGNNFTVANPGDGGSSTQIGDLLTIIIGWVSSSQALPNTPAGWTQIRAYYHATWGGLAVYQRVATAAGVQPSVNFTIVDLTEVAYSGRGLWRKTNAVWAVDYVLSDPDATADATWSTDAQDVLEVAAGDFVLAISRRQYQDTSPTMTTFDVSATGATIGTETNRGHVVMSNNVTRDIHLVEAQCSAGDATGLLHLGYSITSGDNPRGFTLFVRLRDEGHPPLTSRPPEIDLVTPPVGALGLTEDIVIDITDLDGDLQRFDVYVTLPTVGLTELARTWEADDPGEFEFNFGAFSTIETLPDGTIRIHLRRNTGWVDTTIGVSVSATDDQGNMTGNFWEWTTSYSGSYGCDELPGSPPEIEIISPLPYNDPSEVIPDTSHLVFQITDPDEGAAFATATLTIDLIGEADNFTLPAGSLFETAAGIQFATDEALAIVAGPPQTIAATAVVAGAAGNVAAGDINVVTDGQDHPDAPGTELDEVITVTNADAAAGGEGVAGGGLKWIIPILEFPDALITLGAQLIHDGHEFYPLFEGSTRTEIAGGYEYDVIWHTGRWPSRPTLLPFVIDMQGKSAP